jgi:hypothetical protein
MELFFSQRCHLQEQKGGVDFNVERWIVRPGIDCRIVHDCEIFQKEVYRTREDIRGRENWKKMEKTWVLVG